MERYRTARASAVIAVAGLALGSCASETKAGQREQQQTSNVKLSDEVRERTNAGKGILISPYAIESATSDGALVRPYAVSNGSVACNGTKQRIFDIDEIAIVSPDGTSLTTRQVPDEDELLINANAGNVTPTTADCISHDTPPKNPTKIATTWQRPDGTIVKIGGVTDQRVNVLAPIG